MATMLKMPEKQKLRETTTRAKETFHRVQNVGGTERFGRIAGGVAATIAAFAVGAPWLKAIMAAAGVIGLATGLSGYCPVNKAAGRDSYHPMKPTGGSESSKPE